MDGKYSGFIEINKFKQICQFVSVGFKTMKQFVVKDVNFGFFYTFTGHKNQSAISVNLL